MSGKGKWVVFCDQCYSYRKELPNAKQASYEAVHHMKMNPGHSAHINAPDNKK